MEKNAVQYIKFKKYSWKNTKEIVEKPYHIEIVITNVLS